MQRKTYALIDGDILKENVKEIKQKYPNYEYYIGVVKNNAYHHGMKSIISLKEGGINYFAVSSLEEALQLRHYDTKTPVLCLEPISLEAIDDIENNNITITVESLDYLKELVNKNLFTDIKIHLAVDSGMNRLGFQEAKELELAVQMIEDTKHLILEGLYSHFATSGVMDPYYDKQCERFLSITQNIDLKRIPIIHMGRSLSLVQHPKIPFCNGIRLGIIMYGFAQSYTPGTDIKSKLRTLKRNYLQKKYNCSALLANDLVLHQAFSLYTEVMSSRHVSVNDNVGYNVYPIKEEGYILTLPIGYADGVTKEFGYVSIKGHKLPIVSDCMDMIMVFSKESIPVHTKVEIFGDDISIASVCQRTNQNAYHLFNHISNRVIRVHKRKDEKEEIQY